MIGNILRWLGHGLKHSLRCQALAGIADVAELYSTLATINVTGSKVPAECFVSGVLNVRVRVNLIGGFHVLADGAGWRFGSGDHRAGVDLADFLLDILYGNGFPG